MINWSLYKQSIKSNYKILLIFLAILTLYITVIIGIYNPTSMNALAEFYESMPEIMAMVGMNGDSTSLIGFLITYLYGFLFLVLPLVVTIIISNRLIASHVDRGSMAYLLSSPNSRGKIIFTQIKVLATSILMVIAYCTIVTIISCALMHPGELEIGKLLIINLGLLAFHLFIGGICFLSSTIFDETKYSLMFGAGIPFVFYLIQMLANMGGKLENLKYFTIFSLFRPLDIINGKTSAYLMIVILFLMAFILYILSYFIFKKKNLSI